MQKIKTYLNNRIYDYWDKDAHFEEVDSGNLTTFLQKNGTCEGLTKKLPPLDITLNIQPSENYFQDISVMTHKILRIHSRELLIEDEDGTCTFGIGFN